MQLLMTAMAVAIGLIFSFTVAFAVEEFIFGKALRGLFGQPFGATKKSPPNC